MARYRELFLGDDYVVTQLPSYDPATTANPFKTFAALPARSRYQFMLDDAHFFVEGFIKGPVCRGQVALNVINDHFFIAFFDPARDTDQQRYALSQPGQRSVEHPLRKKEHAAVVKHLAPLCRPSERIPDGPRKSI